MTKNLHLEKLRIKEKMSTRSYNICANNQLLSIADIIDYYKSNKTFRKLNRCGPKSQQELEKIYLKYRKNETSIMIEKDIDDSEMQRIFKRIKKHKLKCQYLFAEGNVLYDRLSIRAKHSVLTLIEDIGFDLEKFVAKTIFTTCNFGMIKATGKKTVKELTQLKNGVQKMLIDLDSKEFSKLDLLITEIERALNLNLKKDTQLIESIETRQLNLVQFFDNYVLNSNLCSARDKMLFMYVIQSGKYLKDKTYFAPVVKKHKLTNERIRQLRDEFYKEFPVKFDFIPKLFEYSYDLNFNIYERKYWRITAQPLNKYLKERIENTANSLGNLIKYFGGNKYYSLTRSLKLKGCYRPFELDTYNRHRRFEVPCIIHHDFIPKNTMIEILNTVYSKIYGKIKKDCIYEFDEFNLDSEQQKFVADIVSRNFHLEHSNMGGVHLKRNTLVTAPEKIETILREHNKQMSAQEIHAEYNRRYTKKYKPINSVISALHGDQFIYLKGSSKLYGLKEWESST